MQNLLYLCLLSLFSLFACGNNAPDSEPVPFGDDAIEVPLRYLALGDSYTIGESVAETQRWPVLLTDDLRREGFDIAAPRIIARTGWTTKNLQNGIDDADIDNETFDIVSLLIGVNNQFQGRSLEEYKTQFAELLQQAVDFAAGDKTRVFVVSIPDYAFTPFGQNSGNAETISAEIDVFNAAAREITETEEIPFYNITPISRQGNDDPELVAGDGLHPSGKQYQLWVDSFVAEVAELLRD